jgi:hypothetical protein
MNAFLESTFQELASYEISSAFIGGLGSLANMSDKPDAR